MFKFIFEYKVQLDSRPHEYQTSRMIKETHALQGFQTKQIFIYTPLNM